MTQSWKSWLFLVLGVWLVVSPYALDALGLSLNFSNLATGVIIALVALWNLFGGKKES